MGTMTSRRLLMLAYHYPPDGASGAARPHRLAKYLGRLGYEIDVIALGSGAQSDHVYRVGENGGGWWPAVCRAAHRLAPYNDRLTWTPGVVRLGSQLMEQCKYGAIVSTAPPFSSHLAAICLKRSHPVKVIADFRDPLVGNPFRTRSLGRPYDRSLESAIVHGADAIIANTQAAGDMLRQRYPHARVEVIWNGFDPEDGSAAPSVPAAQQALGHIGSIYGGRHPLQILESIIRLLDSGRLRPQDALVRLIGPIVDSPFSLETEAVAKLRSIGCFEGDGQRVSPAAASKATSECSRLLLLDSNDRKIGLQVPAKLFEYIRSGKPVLASTARGSMSEWILERSGIRFASVYPDDGPAEADRKIEEFFKASAQPSAPSAWFNDTFAAPRQAAQLASILDSLG